MPLGLGASLSRAGIVTPGMITDGLVMRHMYSAGAVQPLSDGAAYFVSGDRIRVSDSNDFTFTAGNAFSVGCWFNSPTIGTDTLIGKFENTTASNANNEWYFQLASGGLLALQCFDPSESAIIGRKYNTALSSNTWYHGFATYDGGTTDASVKIYLDGVRVDDSNQNAGSGFASMDNTATNLTFGRSDGGVVNYAGYMCNAGIWSRELTQAEIKSIMWKQYADLSTTEKTNLISWWDLDSVPQVSNSYRTGTNKGYIAYSDGASDHGANIAFKDFVPTNDIELGSDIFGGEGSFTSDTGYWNLSNDTTISNGVVITDSGSGTYNGIAKSSILTAGKIYKLSFDVIEANTADTLVRFNWGDYTDAADDAYPVIWSNTSGSTDTTGSYYMYFEPGANTATTFIIYCSQSGTGDYVEVKLDNIVCQEVLNAGKST
jgi:hypothetical protein